MKSSKSIQTIIIALFYLLFFLTPLYFRFITEELFEFNKMVLVYTLTTAITGMWIFRMITEKSLILKRTFLDVPILFFVGAQLLSTIFSLHPHTSLLGYYSRFHGGLFSTVSYVLLYYAFVSNIEKKQLTLLFGALFSSLSLVSLWGIFEHFGRSLSCVLLTGNFNVACWVQDVQNRVYASFGQPNWMAAFIVGLLPLLWAKLSITKTSSVEKIIFFSTTVLGLIALYYTKSRSGFLALISSAGLFFGYLTYLGFTKRKSNQKQEKNIPSLNTKMSIVTVGILVFCTLLIGTPYTPSLQEMFAPPTPPAAPAPSAAPVQVNRLEEGGTDSGEIRKIVWQGAIDIWKRYPLLGSGVETFAYSYYKDRPTAHNLVSEWDFLYNKAHNEFLNVLATTGMLGLISYLSVFIVAAARLATILFSKKNKYSVSDTILAAGIGAGIVALTVSNFFGFSTVMIAVLLFTYFGCISLLTDTRVQAAATSPKKNKKTSESFETWQYVTATFLALAVIFLVAKIYMYWAADVRYASAKTLLRSGKYESGLTQMQEAITLSPNEALYYDTYSSELARIAVALAEQNEATAAAQTAQSAIVMSDQALTLNDAHLNFYKTRARMFITLAQLEPQLLLEARDTLEAAIERAPNDPKLYYNLGVVEVSLENTEKGLSLLEKTIELKPDYPAARLQLGKEYLELQEFEKARTHFTYILTEIDPNNAASIQELLLLETLEASAAATAQ